MASIRIINSNGRFSLCKRTPDPSGQADYERLAWLTREQAISIIGPHTGIGSVNLPVNPDPTDRKAIYIDRVQDRAPLTRSWNLRVGDEHVSRISDEAVHALQELAIVHFEPGQPDWKSREVEILDDKILEWEESLATLKARREAISAEISLEEPLSAIL